MNTENLLKLAEHMERVPPENLDMANWYSAKVRDSENLTRVVGYEPVDQADLPPITADSLHGTECGTACCLAGHAIVLLGLRTMFPSAGAAMALGLSTGDATALFHGPWAGPKEAAGVLRWLAGGKAGPAPEGWLGDWG